jgi:hypothetical protein
MADAPDLHSGGFCVSVWIRVKFGRDALAFRQVTLKHIVQGNARRNGLKIEVLAVSLLFVAHQFNRVFPGKLREFTI